MIRLARDLRLPIVLGAIGVVAPGELVRIARFFEGPAGLYVAAAIRVLLGVALVLAASCARARQRRCGSSVRSSPWLDSSPPPSGSTGPGPSSSGGPRRGPL